ncbi:MAG: hypothetical protein WKG52_14385 [Variovorax sp.]
MARPLSQNEEFAGMLTTLVAEGCVASETGSTSRSSLQASVPGKDAVYVRLGLDALLELGIFKASKDAIALTDVGNMFLLDIQAAESGVNTDIENRGALKKARAAIERDHRLVPPASHEEMRTLPGRLENYRADRKHPFLNVWTGLIAVSVVAGVFFLVA